MGNVYTMVSTTRRSVTILIVDDEPAVRRIAVLLLESAGFQTLQAGSAEEAISICDTESVAVVLSDVQMPGMNGFALERELQVKHAGLPIVFMTGYIAEVSPFPEGRPILKKPFNSETLVRAVRQSSGLAGSERQVA